jgi:hypothetical protein
MALVIPVSHSNEKGLRRALDRIAPFNWAEGKNIYLFGFAGQQDEDFITALCEFCQNKGVKDVLLPDPHERNRVERTLRKAGYSVSLGPGITNLVHGTGLDTCLRKYGFDWRSDVTHRLTHYALGTVGEKEIETWIAQFDRLGDHRSVGEHLVQLVDVLPQSELGNSLSNGSDFHRSDLVIGFNRDKWGKSWGPVSNLVSKICPSAIVLPITEAITVGIPPKVVRLVEDGLFSGTELRGVLDSLQGKRAPNRIQKVPALEDVNALSKVSAQWYFGVVTDFGEALMRQYAAANGLPNIQIVTGAAARKFSVLLGDSSPFVASKEERSENDRMKEYRSYLRSKVEPIAFQERMGWKDDTARSRAREFCEVVGEQLWKNYIVKKNLDLNDWPDERISLCALGMERLGLTFAFSHSVPKASLPVFWSRGKVTFRGVTIDWAPLFPNADT